MTLTPYPFLFAALAIAARLPFLISGKIAFDSDEAVEGLMARHVLHGDFPAFFWGQAYKGVPEVYAAAGAFAVFGPSVAVLKSVTLAFFAAYIAVNFILLDTIAGRRLAVAASLLLIVAPPALVFWSLDASAEYILIMLLGTIFLLLCLRLERAEERPRAKSQEAKAEIAAIGLVIGLGLWVQLIFVFYLIPVALILLLQSNWWRLRTFDRFGTPVKALGAIATIYLALAVIAFLTGGFSIQLGSLALGARSPQKMLRIALGIGALAAMLYVLGHASRTAVRRSAGRYWPLAAGFLVGYLPALLHSVFVEPVRTAAGVADLRRLVSAAPDLLGNVIPILSGFKMATTERLPVPLVAVVPIAGTLVAYLWANRARLLSIARLRPEVAGLARDFFPIFIVFVPLLFVVSGAYGDTQSYRYLIPYYAGLAVALAEGSLVLARNNRLLAGIVVGAMLVVFGWQQIIWYRKLTPDAQSLKTIDCLRREGIRGGYADYWTSYKLTFLSNEEIIIAPTTGIDRYPDYTEFVRSLPAPAGPDHPCLK